ncbi:MAG: hypothetical protein VW362_06855, partial [Candidatus Nanopelagicales bacterium]
MQYRGGYFPAVVDPMLVPEGALRADQAALESQQNGFMFPTTGRGFTYRRVESYRRPLQLDLSFIPSHMDKVLRFTHIEPRVREVGRLARNADFRATMSSMVDPEVISVMIVPWLQRAASQRVAEVSHARDDRSLDKAFRYLRSNTGAQVMVANV